MDSDLKGFNINEHINEHVKDIQQIFEVFKHSRVTKTPMQRLPRHMRRRAMSYNVNRMPRRWRHYAKQMVQKSKHRKKPPSRFTRRRRKFADGTDPTLLKTHRWHAKRYRMIKAFGMKLPYECYQKVKRSCIRNAARACCVVDHSYWKIIQIRITNEFNRFLIELSRIQDLPNFEDNRCHELVLFKLNSKSYKNCLGPIIIRKIKEIDELFYEISCHPSVVPGLFEEFKIFEPKLIENKARLTFYGPESLDKIVETLKIKETVNEDDDFYDVLDGAVIVESVVFKLKGILTKDKQFEFDLFYKNGLPNMILDIVFDINMEKDVFYKFVHNKCRVLGLSDEYNVRCSYNLLNFPEDAMDFIDSSFIEAEIDELMTKHYKRPKNRRVNYEKLSEDDPFTFNFDDINDINEIVTIKIQPIKKGSPQRLGFIYSEVEEATDLKAETLNEDIEMNEDEDENIPKKKQKFNEFESIDMFARSKYQKIVPMSRLFDIIEKPKISKRQKKKLKLQKIEEVIEDVKKIYIIPQGKMIGRIVRGLRWANRHGAYYAFAYCPKKFIDDLKQKGQNWIYFRNINSKPYRKANFTVLDSNTRFF